MADLMSMEPTLVKCTCLPSPVVVITSFIEVKVVVLLEIPLFFRRKVIEATFLSVLDCGDICMHACFNCDFEAPLDAV